MLKAIRTDAFLFSRFTQPESFRFPFLPSLTKYFAMFSGHYMIRMLRKNIYTTGKYMRVSIQQFIPADQIIANLALFVVNVSVPVWVWNKKVFQLLVIPEAS